MSLFKTFKNTPLYEVLRDLMAGSRPATSPSLPSTIIIEPNPIRLQMHKQKNKRYSDDKVPIWRGRDSGTFKKLRAAHDRHGRGRWTGYPQLDGKL